MDLVLASASPRRADLLRQAGLAFDVVSIATPEKTSGGSAGALALENARKKAEAVAKRRPNAWVVAADTLGELDGRVLAKPLGPEEAVRMLLDMSGRTHRVMTAVCVVAPGNRAPFQHVEETEVTFADLTESQVRSYVATGEPLDKAGAYAIQGLGAALVAGISGDFTNVVGLPVAATLALLRQAGYPIGDPRTGSP